VAHRESKGMESRVTVYSTFSGFLPDFRVIWDFVYASPWRADHRFGARCWTEEITSLNEKSVKVSSLTSLPAGERKTEPTACSSRSTTSPKHSDETFP
jgi:hypothetical protein